TPAPKIGSPARARWPFWSCAKFEAAIPITTPGKLCSPRIEGSQMEKKQWRVGDLQTMQGADPRAMTMIGFVLYDETGQPSVTFGYGTHDEARKGREYVMAALIGAETVRGRR